MFAELENPLFIDPHELDQYLADGWFRMGQSVFTTNFLKFNHVFYSALWLRINLLEAEFPTTKSKLQKLNSKFEVEIQPAQIKPIQETLFDKYRSHITFETSNSLEQLLFNNTQRDIFNAYEVNVYDKEKLIATGFFDLGHDSGAGISCFYDPDYKKHSLGKYLMFLKMDFCIKRGLTFFYPGYFAPGYRLFDYKLDLTKSAMEFLDFRDNQWYPMSTFSADNTPLIEIQERLNELQMLIENAGQISKVYHYEYFDANLVPSLNGLGLLDHPVMLVCFERQPNQINPIVLFDIRKKHYQLWLCNSVYGMTYESEYDNFYGEHLLHPFRHLVSCDTAEAMAQVVTTALVKVDD
ncbi:arginyl-tRNA--protein arginylyltransferase [Flectobacillus sp. BAB-3569]|uniref:arginyl-tRNA--protein arginylyltransferase n=1 Tax=Flectobacillus sp. BAB-3569 TaxID=1509483 RepID=UPI000BA3FB1F|nr:arginyl-tRNA--protein arginylyltransferase [Flectobacillus sp. BAB-3569]PAC31449.1 arginyl-tRNA--protein arginylyltransferase [Flectobacillus sp. BAB-3569]